MFSTALEIVHCHGQRVLSLPTELLVPKVWNGVLNDLDKSIVVQGVSRVERGSKGSSSTFIFVMSAVLRHLRRRCLPRSSRIIQTRNRLLPTARLHSASTIFATLSS